MLSYNYRNKIVSAVSAFGLKEFGICDNTLHFKNWLDANINSPCLY